MSKEKQIEEMAFDLCRIALCKHLEQEECDATTCAHCAAEALYDAGYRKQSEWISVEERLPKEDGKYIVHNRSGMVFQAKYYSSPKTWGMVDKGVNITHWMPMPEPPKKGGAE